MTKYKKTFKLYGWALLGFIVILIIFNLFTFTVNEMEQVVIKQFNQIIKVVIDDEGYEDIKTELNNNPDFDDIKVLKGKGLFFKVPFLHTVERYSNRLLTYDTDPREVISLDKKKLVLDNFAQWQIYNPVYFVDTLGNERKAHSRIDEILYSKINEEIGKQVALTIISDKEYITEMLKEITLVTNIVLKEYGVKLIDIRIKRTDLPIENYENVFNRMRTEREKEAKKYRSEGNEEAQIIRSEADRDATIIEAKAYETAELLKGEGDAEALRIYADAFNKDLDFYEFWRTLETYKRTLGKNAKIVIDKNSPFAKYLFGE